MIDKITDFEFWVKDVIRQVRNILSRRKVPHRFQKGSTIICIKGSDLISILTELLAVADLRIIDTMDVGPKDSEEVTDIRLRPGRPKPKILFIGKTQSGKSTIINQCFGVEEATIGITGVGETKIPDSDRQLLQYHTDKYTLIDTAGLGEASDGTVPNHVAVKHLFDIFESNLLLNLCVICIRGVIDESIETTMKFYKEIIPNGLPVLLVITNCHDKPVIKFKELVQKHEIKVIDVIGIDIPYPVGPDSDEYDHYRRKHELYANFVKLKVTLCMADRPTNIWSTIAQMRSKLNTIILQLRNMKLVDMEISWDRIARMLKMTTQDREEFFRLLSKGKTAECDAEIKAFIDNKTTVDSFLKAKEEELRILTGGYHRGYLPALSDFDD